MYAGFWRRFAAMLIDVLAVTVPMIVLGIVVALLTGPRSRATALADLSLPLAFWLYFAICESSSLQATPGKRAFGMRVTDLRGHRLSFARASARFLTKIFSVVSLGVGFLLSAISVRKQALHDMVSNCLVIDAHTTPADLREDGLARALSGGVIVTLLVAALCVPLAVAGTAIAIPRYQDYVVRKSVDEVLRSARGMTADVAAYMRRYRIVPRSFEEAQAAPGSPYLREATIARDGRIVLTLAIRRLEGKRITFVPATSTGGEIVWRCTAEEIASRYLPAQCASER